MKLPLPIRSCAVLLLLGTALGQPPKPSQGDVQAVYLYQFARFVRWPSVTDRGLDMCIAGQMSYVDALKKAVVGESIDGRSLGVRRVQRPEEETGCDVLFMDATVKDSMDAMLAAAAGKPTLTVSDMPGFLERGGMIQFVLIDNRVRFAVDLRPVQTSGLALSSELLKVAVAVNGKPAAGGAL